MGALSCTDGKYYHDWQLNPSFREGTLYAQEVMCPAHHVTNSCAAQDVGTCDVCSAAVENYDDPILECRLCNWWSCSSCNESAALPKKEFKYISTAPDVKGQDEDPGVPLGNGTCLHCNKPKGQHAAKGVLSVLSMKFNKLATKEVGKALAQALAVNSTLQELDVSSNNWKNRRGYWVGDGLGFAQELAVGIKDNGALSSLSLKSSKLISHGDQGKAAGMALGAMLAVNTVLTELDLSSNGEFCNTSGTRFVQELAVGLSDNGTLSSFTFGDKQAVTMTTAMTVANFSGKLKSYEAHLVCAFLPKCT
jgi:hypothetical protein